MKILFFTSPVEDYLGDAVLHGLRERYGADCVDFPKCEIMYKNCPEHILKQVRGNGFTLYSGLLEDIEVDRFNIEQKIKDNYYDLIIISDIQRQYGWFVHFRPWLNSSNTIILDGMDTDQPYPSRGLWWRRPVFWFLPKAHKQFLYFKREWTPATSFNIWNRALPKSIANSLPQYRNLRKIAFSIPLEKIVKSLPEKKKRFTTHIVDEEVALKVPGSHISYAFINEHDYYQDIRDSRYGITTMRAGWDCLRHYEIAANGTVMCFKNLHHKSDLCAPHGLIDQVNCISYQNYDQLIEKTEALTEEQYLTLQRNSIQWALSNSTQNRALELVNEYQKCRLQSV